jgi:hypothetical protein
LSTANLSFDLADGGHAHHLSHYSLWFSASLSPKDPMMDSRMLGIRNFATAVTFSFILGIGSQQQYHPAALPNDHACFSP